jgi:hypothetical protein
MPKFALAALPFISRHASAPAFKTLGEWCDGDGYSLVGGDSKELLDWACVSWAMTGLDVLRGITLSKTSTPEQKNPLEVSPGGVCGRSMGRGLSGVESS